MSNADTLAFISAFFCGCLILIVAWNKQHSAPRWAFIAGMTALAASDIFSALTTYAVTPEEKVHWQYWKMVAMSFLPGTWLFFSLAYARGNYLEFLKKWRLILVAAFLFPMGLVIFFGRHLIISDGETILEHSMFRLGMSGLIFNLCCLVGWVLILMNLERTYRAAVGTMLWRIKSMILGLGVIFAVRAYVSSQVMLFMPWISDLMPSPIWECYWADC